MGCWGFYDCDNDSSADDFCEFLDFIRLDEGGLREYIYDEEEEAYEKILSYVEKMETRVSGFALQLLKVINDSKNKFPVEIPEGFPKYIVERALEESKSSSVTVLEE